ncbi:MAG: motility protein MotB [Hydrogenophilales bacterium CG03_land_8_20_14_0_80_62_28]|nr:flagellar motor protein MotB [Betaproteobacteria bacterium]OIO77631.1 MAG: flagellar motor protein MotB [Hydrogenophilaceae bacterium CG1_02_62_390]PIV24462.1 MAG: motility protein MotB [Hydrogenophilales bacterium CG03_land_8_20_14_0_80_62_28]PIW37861.1 MAG: motility protein MotB [Hydrogenophilales bacterium CG15_BIG_FIL_POST_REV_8_21_14_020_62_31]PIW70872.1 MAG: motility protein MotB [Hydrogenophilales bacterium CG12_big_fil_rev_8_21_14_0_65_61_21]PIX01625.1 MAG: motility protein MotB [Hy
MADDTQRPIIIKRIKKSGSAAHGGAWKIAYADFVTAMMAFFLLMWLLGSTTKAQMEGIAEYFKTPLKVALTGGSGAGDATSIIKGGGTDLTRKTGQVMKSEDAKKKTVISLDKSKSEKEEKARLQDMKAKLDKLIEQNAKLKPYKNQLKIDMTDEGLRIQIVDDKNRPMFDSGGAAMKPYTREILQAIGKTLNELPNRISLSGHTDAVRYTTGERGYSNWELSADRANASRRELVSGGLEDGKIMRVVGLGSAVPFNKDNVNDPVNRRMSIIVMNRKAEEAITREAGNQIEGSTANQIGTQLERRK